jgi:hypothetical protein
MPPKPTGARAIAAATLDALRHDAPIVSTMTVELPLPEGGTFRARLVRTEVLAPDATVTVARLEGGTIVERPIAADLAAFALSVEGFPESRGFLAVTPGMVGGFAQIGERTLWISSGPVGRGLPAVVFDADRAHPSFLPSGESFCHVEELVGPPMPKSGGGGVAGPTELCRELSLAIETDAEYLSALFGGDSLAAAAYAIALTGACSEIFADDLDVRLRVSSIRLWDGPDPWDQSSTVDQLFQFKDFWLANESSTPRDLAHYLSGRGLGGGVAWLPGLCSGNEYSYALSANLNGAFPYPLLDNNGANWDIMVFAHENGHSFGAPHTHSYDPPLDGCGNGDCSQAAQGTIMSYCHLCSGGLTNIALQFHPENVVSMLGFLASVGCDWSDGTAGAFAEDDLIVAQSGSTVSIDALWNDERANCPAIALAAFDAITAQGHAVTLVPPITPDSRPTFAVTVPASAIADDSFSYTISDESGATASATVTIDVRPTFPATVVNASEDGALATYFEIGELEVLPDFAALSPYATDVVPFVNFPSSDGAFATSGRADLVAASFEGWIKVPTTGTYTLFIESDDGSRLVVDGQVVVSNDGLHGMVEKSGSIGLAAGYHPIRIEFFERYGGAGLVARWTGPGLIKKPIPAFAWSHGGVVPTPDLDGDGSVGGSDLAILLGAWGTDSPTADLTGDGVVNAADLAILLGSWT